MSHPFYRTSSNTSGLPSRMSAKVWNRLKKLAHGVWEMESSTSGPVAVRKRDESAQLSAGAHSGTPSKFDVLEEATPHNIDTGDLVLLFMGGQRVAARVLGKSADGMLRLGTHEGELTEIPQTWVRKSQAQEQMQRSRSITREDIPVQNPAQVKPASPPQLQNNQAQIADSLAQAIQSKGGKVQVRLSPSSVLEITSNGSSFTAQLSHTSTKVVSNTSYPSMQHLVQSLGLNDYPQVIS